MVAMKLLEGKIVLVTGGGSGIGRASAVLFAQEGATVIVANRNAEKGEEAVNTIRAMNGAAYFHQTDVSKKDDIEALFKFIIKKFGRLDCAFNNAGIDGKKTSIIDLKEEEWDEIIDTNLKGTFLLMKYELTEMIKLKKGSIVNMSSVCGIVARPDRCAYNASRHGVIGLTKSAALEYSKHGIRINAVGPGSIETDIFYRSTGGDPDRMKLYHQAHPIGRIGRPEEVAQTVLWLMSEAPPFISGQTIMIDGGFTIQ